MVRRASLCRAAALTGNLPSNWQCSASSAAAIPCAQPCKATSPSTVASNTSHGSQSVELEKTDVTNSANSKSKFNLENIKITNNSSGFTPESKSDCVSALGASNSDRFVSEGDSVSPDSSEPCNVKVPPCKKRLSKRKHGLIPNAVCKKKALGILPKVTIPLNCANMLTNSVKKRRNSAEQSNSQKVAVESNFSLKNVKTEPEELTGCDSFDHSLCSNLHHEKEEVLAKSGVVQQNLCAALFPAPKNSVEMIVVKNEPIEEPHYEIPFGSPTSDPLAENIKTEHSEGSSSYLSRLFDNAPDDVGAALAPGDKKNVPRSSKYENVYNTVSNIVHSLHAPLSIIDGAFSLFEKVVSCGLLRGRPTALIASSCVYFVCRQDGVPRTFLEIAAVSNVSKKELGRSFKLILRGLDTSLSMIKTDDFMCRFCHSLGLGDKAIDAAEYIAKKAAQMNLVHGRSPVTVSAAAIYMAAQASGVPRSALEISKVTGISESTVVVAYRSIYPYAKELFPPNFIFHKSIENLTTARLIF